MPKSTEKTTRAKSPALDRLLGQKLPVLDNGFVRVVDRSIISL
jgi:hypothetical protein